ncbi:universal stress protein [Pseudomonas fluorescens]|uniref:UspA domain-containing protein n=2 Tax=Pseudomonas TaxID=286 RepID=A0A166PV68_PSEFL|nr:hypothetical protein A1D17_25550 [Pseudomonas fluorescens]
MSQTQRLLLIAPCAMTRTPAFDRAAMLARAMQLPLHIVKGTVQHTGLNRLLGTIAEQLLHRAPCSVLAIKSGRMLQGE